MCPLNTLSGDRSFLLFLPLLSPWEGLAPDGGTWACWGGRVLSDGDGSLACKEGWGRVSGPPQPWEAAGPTSSSPRKGRTSSTLRKTQEASLENIGLGPSPFPHGGLRLFCR